jgi:hypothetical protein
MSITVRRLISQGKTRYYLRPEEKPLAIAHERLSGELFGLTCAGCDLRKEGVTVNVTQESNPKQSWIINPEARSQPPHCD